MVIYTINLKVTEIITTHHEKNALNTIMLSSNTICTKGTIFVGNASDFCISYLFKNLLDILCIENYKK